MRDELVHLQLARQVIVHQIRQLAPALDPAKRTAFPDAAGDELEGWKGNEVAVVSRGVAIWNYRVGGGCGGKNVVVLLRRGESDERKKRGKRAYAWC